MVDRRGLELRVGDGVRIYTCYHTVILGFELDPVGNEWAKVKTSGGFGYVYPEEVTLIEPGGGE